LTPEQESIKKFAESTDVTPCGAGVCTAHDHTPEMNEWTPRHCSEVEICLAWIKSTCTPTVRIHRKTGSSYYLKHVVEREMSHYVSNGAFIIAALMSGYRRTGGFNPYFNLKRIETGGITP